MSKSLKYKLGDRVTFTREYWKRRNQGRTRWVSYTKFSPSRKGMIVGVRTVQEGETVNGGEDGMPYFVAESRIRMWLIATTLNQKPFYAKEEDIEQHQEQIGSEQ